METDAKKVYDVLKKWHDREGPGGLEFRFDFMAQSFSHALWALGSSPKELEKLVKNLERQEQNIDRQLPLMLGFGHNALVMQLNIPNRAAQRPKIKRDVNILFVESFNEGKSVVLSCDQAGLNISLRSVRRITSVWPACPRVDDEDKPPLAHFPYTFSRPLGEVAWGYS